MIKLQSILFILILSISTLACVKIKAKSEKYVWQNIAAKSDYAISYNYPVFIVDGKMLALNDGGWFSTNGKNWTKTELPKSRLNSAYQKFVQFKGAVYALGEMDGNYLNFKLLSKIVRTKDGKTWETVAEKSNLPQRVFYGAVVFKDKIWIIGGFDGEKYYNDIWNSADGVNWNRISEKSGWSERIISKIIVFKNRIWLIGGGVIDGEKEINPNSASEIWSSADGTIWKKHQTNATNKIAGTPVVFDDKLWLIGANRNDGNFASAVLVSDDGENWQELSALWTPRGGVAVWVFDNKLFMTGGKYSYNENSEIKFVYSNDVWAMRKTE
ncbi:MAG: hypothetical protein AAB336_00725 [Acidobacteriota bacterium]